MTPAPDPEDQSRHRKLGFRITSQRRLILKAVGRAVQHATLDEIYAQFKSIAPKINKATAYLSLPTSRRVWLINSNEIAGRRVY